MYRKTIQERLEELKATSQGLSSEQRSQRRQQYGYNEILDEDRPSFFAIFFEQFKQITVWILLVLAGFTAFLGQYYQAIAILVMMLISLLIRALQANRAQKALAALRTMASPRCLVLQEGKVVEIERRELVPGDIVLLEAGNLVPADGRLLESYNLHIDESLLTGEFRSVEKDINFAPRENVPLGDRVNMAYASTAITSGKGSMLVTNTGMDTEIGKIAFMLYKDEESRVPLAKRLSKLAYSLGVLAFLLVGGFGVYAFLIAGVPLESTLSSSLSLLISSIPQGLSALAVITLGLGLYRIAKNDALVKRMESIEKLGSVSVICADKSRILTQNKMKVTDLSTGSDDDEEWMKKICLLCNDVRIGEDSFGDPIEVALMEYALDGEHDLNQLKEDYPLLEELAFDSSRKRMTTLHQDGDRKLLLSKGGLHEILEISTNYRVDGESFPLDDEIREGIMESYASYASQGKRILAMAYRYGEELREEDMTFLGLIALFDPPLEGVIESVKVCKRAGIRPIMITGDHLLTAKQIAQEVGILTEGYQAISGDELDALSDEEFKEKVEDYSVYAGVNLQHRARILQAWQDKDHIVAMTGKEINQASTLRKADLGVGLHIGGTDVTKAASDILLKEGNFATLVNAIEEGRMIFANLRRTIRFMLSGSLSILLLMIAGVIVYGKMPLLPLQILLITLITSVFPALALEVEPKERNIMMGEPRAMNKSVLNTKAFVLTVLEAIVMAGAGFVAYTLGKQMDPALAQTTTFMTMGMIQLFHAFNMRNSQSVLGRDFFSNKIFFPAVFLSALILVITVFLPPLQEIFGTQLLQPQQWGLILILSFGMVLITEIRKLFVRE